MHSSEIMTSIVMKREGQENLTYTLIKSKDAVMKTKKETKTTTNRVRREVITSHHEKIEDQSKSDTEIQSSIEKGEPILGSNSVEQNCGKNEIDCVENQNGESV